MSYYNPIQMTLTALANAAVSAAADIVQFVSPTGKRGRILGVSIVTKVATTDAAAELRIGTVADPDAYGTIAIPITAVDTAIQLTQAQLDAFLELPADTVILISGDGAATAGSLDLAFTIGWS
jgi:hypothetical protein